MAKLKKHKNENRTLIVKFENLSKYHQILENGKSFMEYVLAFILSFGFQLKHKCSCSGKSAFTRHSHYARIRLNGLTIWRIQCTECKATFTILPDFVLRYSHLSRDELHSALLCTHGGLSLELSGMVCHIHPMALYRWICTLGRNEMVSLLTKAHLPLPSYFLADEKHSSCLSQKVYLPTIVEGRVIWHLGYTDEATAQAFKESYEKFKKAALAIEASYQPHGILTDGFESTQKCLQELFPKAKLGACLLHAAKKMSSKVKDIPHTELKTLQAQFSKLFFNAPKSLGLHVFSVGQRLRRFIDLVRKLAGDSQAQAIEAWIKSKKDSWFKTLGDKSMPRTSTLLDQAHNYIDRKIFMMKRFHHKKQGQKLQFINGLAILYNFVPYQRRAKNAGMNAVQVQNGKLPTLDWLLNLLILTTAGGYVGYG